MHLYIYYDVPHAGLGRTSERVRAMQRALGSDATAMRLLRRADSGTASETWMEIYEDVTPGFEARLAAAAEAHELALVAGPRHVERFVDIA